MKNRSVESILFILMFFLLSAWSCPAQDLSADAVCRQKNLTPQQCQELKKRITASGISSNGLNGSNNGFLNGSLNTGQSQDQDLSIDAVCRQKNLTLQQCQILKNQLSSLGNGMEPAAAGNGNTALLQGNRNRPGLSSKPEKKGLFERSRPAGRFQDVSTDLNPFGYDFFRDAAVGMTTDRKDVPVPMNYVVGPGDEVKILLWGRVNGQHNLVVDRDGKIMLPQIGPIFVAGMTFEEMSKKVIAQAQQIVGASVDISMGSLKTIPIFVLGDVRRPGAYTIGSLATITDALLMAGGPTDIGSMRKIQLRRKGRIAGSFDLYDLFLKGDRSNDMTIQRDDVVFVPVVGPIVGIAGNVRRPAIYEIKDTTDLNQVFALAGGIIPSAYMQQIQVSRVQNNERQVVIDLSDREIRNSDRFHMQDADLVRVFSIVDIDRNAVHLEGNVHKPGKFEYKPGMRVRDLIHGVDNLKDETFFEYALIKRIQPPERSTLLVPFSLHRLFIEKDEADNIELRPEDRVFVFSRWMFQDRPFATIEGEIRGDCLEIADLTGDGLEIIPGTKQGTADRKKNWSAQAIRIQRIGEDLERDHQKLLAERVLAISDRLKKKGRYDPKEDLREAAAEMRKMNMSGYLEQISDVEKEFTAACRFPVAENLHVRDAILGAGGLTPDADLETGEVVRFNSDREYETLYFHVGKAMSGDPRENHAVLPKDRIVVHSIWEKIQRQYVYIEGEVSRPGIHVYTKGMKVSDLVFKGGGLLESAYREEAELSSQTVKEGKIGILQHKKIRLNDVLEGKPGADEELNPFDRLLVRRISNWRTEQFASVSGEILFEGKYAFRKGERLSSLIERAGGYTEKAYLRGAVFTRESVRSLQQSSLEDMARRMEKEILSGSATNISSLLSAEDVAARKIELEQKKKLVEVLRQLKATGRMTIQLGHLRVLKGGPYDIELENGDSLYLPPRPSVVNVAGAVMSPTSHLFMERLDYRDYIRLSGGYSRYADEDSIFILKANGSAIRAGDRYLSWSDGRERWELAPFADRDDAMEPGDVVVVPEKLERIAWLREIRDIAQILMNIAATTGIIIKVF
ncbi:MAG: hypothetical protein HPY65_07605 [Syntrophaceae bacterium]|nr:hypothetical protein [Syntrophaceae bacterium]